LLTISKHDGAQKNKLLYSSFYLLPSIWTSSVQVAVQVNFPKKASKEKPELGTETKAETEKKSEKDNAGNERI